MGQKGGAMQKRLRQPIALCLAGLLTVATSGALPISCHQKKKMDLIEQWPGKFKEISNQLENGTYRNRRWGDVEDIGFREIEKDQVEDIKTGQDAIREMKTSGLMPKEIENPQVVDYVSIVA